jgi:hypothetical protein
VAHFGWSEITMSLCYDTTILDHLAEYFLYLAAAPSFWFSLNSSYDHEFHLSRQLGMLPDDYECIMVAAKLAEFHKTRGFFNKLCRLKAFLAGHWFTTNSTVTFEVDTKKIDLNAYTNGVSAELNSKKARQGLGFWSLKKSTDFI